MQYRNDKNGNALSILGFGCMRFTKKNGKIDLAKAENEILEAWQAGVNYYDTAYIYGGSEATIGEIFERNQMREKINIATKLPQYLISSASAVNRFFDEELTRLRTDHVDYYLMHHMTEIIILADLRQFQSADIEIVFSGIVLFDYLLSGSVQNGVHIIDPHISDPVNKNLNIHH